MSTPCFGLDLGTTTSAIGWIVDGRPTLIELDGYALTPSAIFFPPGGAPPVFGHAALNQSALAPERLITSAKRALGTDHVFDLGDVSITPLEASTLLLEYLVSQAALTLGFRPERVVITVPAWFTQTQRSLTRQAASQAGLSVVRLLNEPTAAALAHAHGEDVHRKVLVYDLGGGTFDVSLVHQSGPLLEVLASHGDFHLGGDDVDDNLRDLLFEDLRSAEKGQVVDAIQESPVALARLRMAIEKAKQQLTEVSSVPLHLPKLVDVGGELTDLTTTLTSQDLEEAVLPILSKTTESVDQVLQDTRLSPNDIDVLLFVGGSTRLPLIWKGLFKRYQIQADASLPVQRAVALGAAVQAGLIDGEVVSNAVVDVAPYSLSIGVLTGGLPGAHTHITCEVITPKNTPLPSLHTYLVNTAHPEQERVELMVFQGADSDPTKNTPCCQVVLEDLPPAPSDRLNRPIAVTFRHDVNGMLDIEITDQLSGMSKKAMVSTSQSQEAALLDTLIEQAKEHDYSFGDPFLDGGGPAKNPEDAGITANDFEEAKRFFDDLLSKESELHQEYPEVAHKVLQDANNGVLAANLKRKKLTIDRKSELEDFLFEEGIYL